MKVIQIDLVAVALYIAMGFMLSPLIGDGHWLEFICAEALLIWIATRAYRLGSRMWFHAGYHAGIEDCRKELLAARDALIGAQEGVRDAGKEA